MISNWPRRTLIAVLCAAGLVGPAVWTVRGAEDQGARSPAAAVARLKAGNLRFVVGPEEPLPITAAQRSSAVHEQAPFAAVLSCADSRVPPEVIFRVGLGDLFVVRTAGQVTDRAILASLEYAAEHLHVPLMVVMGHESCGAVRAAIETPASQSQGPNLDYLLRAIRPAASATASASEGARVRDAILRNVENTVNQLVDGSPMLKQLVESGGIGLVGAYYELSTGRVHFSDLVVRPGSGRPAQR